MNSNQLQFSDLLTSDFFQEHYVSRRKNYREITEMLNNNGVCIAKPTVKKYGKRLGFGRDRHECKGMLDWSVSYMNKQVIECVDGFLLGDGHLSNNGQLSASVRHEEFRDYLSNLFLDYGPVKCTIKSSQSSPNGARRFCTKCHPDLKQQRFRWYPNGKKCVPNDIRITPTSVLLWYLGDGHVTKDNQVILFTNNFDRDDVEFLSSNLKNRGVLCHSIRSGKYWVIYISSRDVPKLFQYIGSNSPVRCYDYKFLFPKWMPGSLRISTFAKQYGFKEWNVRKIVKKMSSNSSSTIIRRIHPHGRIWITKDGINVVLRHCKKVKEK